MRELEEAGLPLTQENIDFRIEMEPLMEEAYYLSTDPEEW